MTKLGDQHPTAELADRRVQRYLHACRQVLARDLEVQSVRRRHGVRAETGAPPAAHHLFPHLPHHQMVSETH